MDLRRVKNEDKLDLCRKYWIGGWCLLPFLWCINSFWFFNEAFRKPPFDQQKQIKSYVIRSMVGSLLWMAALVTWICMFQLKRAEWGEFADRISFVIPKGIP
ncbi:PREDICTED: gamma-secretase subunit PEN-2-like [Priapulus caudatus]|uniref:Gamma-secretase subunit PEN-2 n=1 Tax=Priapulus caudatus TaxID=37621 RepID=A0ABM1ETN1_PRICU|nr:PREDICTED: gamma-secretase subunit PEN-2-like [Priapulus caudatus]